MGPRYAKALVFFTSGAVLVLEILAGRLMAPYVGVSLETFTGIIGTMLAGIAVGAAVGGRLADQQNPNRLVGDGLIAGGGLAWLSLPIVALLGPGLGASVPAIVVLALFGFFAPALVLSAISPMVAKLRLADLDRTGEVVGGLSAAGTAGALCGTFLTGFVLVAAVSTRFVVVGLGLILVVWGIVHRVVHATDSTSGGGSDSGDGGGDSGEGGKDGFGVRLAGPLLLAFGVAVTVPQPCDFESVYSCGRVVVDDADPSRRTLVLDTFNHGAVDLDDPTHLEFRYTRVIGAAIDSMPPGPLDALHVGGGAFSIPAYIEATRPGSTQLVLEIDPVLVDVAVDELGLVTGPGLEVVTGDARLALGQLETDGYDLIVGDAFGGLTVPWHLTTTEFVAELDRVLRPGGLYVMNVIDGGRNRFAKAELATLAVHFDHRGVVVIDAVVEDGELPDGPANQILLASDEPTPTLELPADVGSVVADVDTFAGSGRVLRDDFAPVDQMANNR